MKNEFGSLDRFSDKVSQAVIFLDIDEDGRLDVLMQKTTSNNKTAIQIIYNNYVKDTFFIKALMVNRQYSDVVVGASYRFVATDLNDDKFVIIGAQLYQTTYNSLQMQYTYLGVGRSNNYVESFNAATSIGG